MTLSEKILQRQRENAGKMPKGIDGMLDLTPTSDTEYFIFCRTGDLLSKKIKRNHLKNLDPDQVAAYLIKSRE